MSVQSCQDQKRLKKHDLWEKPKQIYRLNKILSPTIEYINVCTSIKKKKALVKIYWYIFIFNLHPRMKTTWSPTNSLTFHIVNASNYHQIQICLLHIHTITAFLLFLGRPSVLLALLSSIWVNRPTLSNSLKGILTVFFCCAHHYVHLLNCVLFRLSSPSTSTLGFQQTSDFHIPSTWFSYRSCLDLLRLAINTHTMG